MRFPESDDEFEQELIQMLELCAEFFEGADLRETRDRLMSAWDVSPHSARLLLVAFHAGWTFGAQLTLVPSSN